MKKIVMIIGLFVSLAANAQLSHAKLVASGLTCSMCSKAIYEALVKVDGIETVKANIQESSYDIAFKKDAVTTPDDIRKAVEGAGFSVAKLQITLTFNSIDVKNDVHANVDGFNLHFLDVQSQTLTGEQVLTVVDKNFVSPKQFKKYSGFTSMKCVSTGVMDNCCKDSKAPGARIYHVTI